MPADGMLATGKGASTPDVPESVRHEGEVWRTMDSSYTCSLGAPGIQVGFLEEVTQEMKSVS